MQPDSMEWGNIVVDTTAITSKMNEYMFRLNGQLGKWLSEKLPQITDKWWLELVFSNLTYLQRDAAEKGHVREISGLDLAANLRIIDRCWFVLKSRFFLNDKDRKSIKKMQVIRNDWAHIVPGKITKERVAANVQVIIDLMQAFGASMKDTGDMERFSLDVEDDKNISTELDKTTVKLVEIADEQTVENDDKGQIQMGSIVCLTSNENKSGAVIGINGNRYTVFIDNKPSVFYAEQIMLKPTVNEIERYVTLSQVRSALIAYQINNPGSGSLYSLNAARIDFVPFQFRPALKMIKADSPRILVADDVGVGKTIEAGLILKELEARHGEVSVLVICPRPLVAERKWQLEMKRFDENFTQLDGKELAEAISETDRDGEWPERHSKTVIPYSLFSEDSILGRQSSTNRRHRNMGLSELDPLPHFDLVIVDEAHNIRNPNTWAYRGVELFCRSADAVVFLTATPLQNSNDDLYTLLNLLRPDMVIDKDTFKTMSAPNQYVNNLLQIVRRQEDGWQAAGKAEIEHILSTDWGRNVIQHSPDFEQVFNFMEQRNPSREDKMDIISRIEGLHSFHTFINRTRRKDIEDFCVRKTQTLDVPFNETQRELYDSLLTFEKRALSRLHGSRGARFMMCTIMRQAASCIYGLAPFMEDLVQKRLKQIQDDGELYEEEFTLTNDEEKSLWKLADEIKTLSRNLPDDDPKFDKMLEAIRQKQNEENNRVIIFSSFRHTLRYVREKLMRAGLRVGQMDGSVPDEERYALRKRFLLDRSDTHAIDVLLFSEVGCEGLDYQFCDTMINYDLPWNPMRIEQRIGRIDRRGQKSDTVRIYNMITQDTIDAVIYERCLLKIGVFEASIGDCSEILGDISDKILQIMFNPELSEQERQAKIEQMADNEVRKVQELHRLEHEEKSFYGFDLSSYMLDKDVQGAENPWINPTSFQELLTAYLNDILGKGEYILGKQEKKTLRISADKRQKLLAELVEQPASNNNNAFKLWKSYLKSNSPNLSITFDGQTAKDNREITFLTQMHPLIVQAARHETREQPCRLAIEVNDSGIKPGEYEFLVYAWKYIGLRPDIKLVAVSNEPVVEQNVLSYLQYAAEYEGDGINHDAGWDSMDSRHYERWQEAKQKYTDDVHAECKYRQEQLQHSWHQQETILKNQLNAADDERIRRMRSAQLENTRLKYEQQLKKLDDITAQADIHTSVLVKGLLRVDGQ